MRHLLDELRDERRRARQEMDGFCRRQRAELETMNRRQREDWETFQQFTRGEVAGNAERHRWSRPIHRRAFGRLVGLPLLRLLI